MGIYWKSTGIKLLRMSDAFFWAGYAHLADAHLVVAAEMVGSIIAAQVASDIFVPW